MSEIKSTTEYKPQAKVPKKPLKTQEQINKEAEEAEERLSASLKILKAAKENFNPFGSKTEETNWGRELSKKLDAEDAKAQAVNNRRQGRKFNTSEYRLEELTSQLEESTAQLKKAEQELQNLRIKQAQDKIAQKEKSELDVSSPQAQDRTQKTQKAINKFKKQRAKLKTNEPLRAKLADQTPTQKIIMDRSKFSNHPQTTNTQSQQSLQNLDQNGQAHSSAA